jgi:WXG100 family type VII secretion target
MAGDTVKYEYAQLEQMSSELAKGAQRLEQTKSFIANAAQQLHNGALLGQAGEALASGLAGQFAKSIGNLEQKYMEMAKDIQAAANDMRQSDQNAAKGFNG